LFTLSNTRIQDVDRHKETWSKPNPLCFFFSSRSINRLALFFFLSREKKKRNTKKWNNKSRDVQNWFASFRYRHSNRLIFVLISVVEFWFNLYVYRWNWFADNNIRKCAVD
jgi:hypothetical protein